MSAQLIFHYDGVPPIHRAIVGAWADERKALRGYLRARYRANLARMAGRPARQAANGQYAASLAYVYAVGRLSALREFAQEVTK